MAEQENKKELFENMPVPKAIFTLAVPTIISQLISVIYNLADTFYVGRTGNPYMIAGVSLAFTVFILNISFANLFGIGGGSQIARMMGAGDDKNAKSVSVFSFYGALAVAVLYALLVYLFMDPILLFLGASENTLEYARQYTLLVTVFGMVPTLMSSVEALLLRNVGCAKQASFGLSGGGVLNIILDPLFMFVVFPEGMEVFAAALATLISNMASCLYLLYMLIKSSAATPLSVHPKYFKQLKKQDAKNVLSVGVPSAVLPGLFDVANVVLNSAMAAHGDYQLAAIGIVMKLERFPNAFGIGLSQGMLPLVAYNYTFGNHDRMKNIIRYGRKVGLGIALFFVVFFAFFAARLTGLFLTDSTVDSAATLIFATAFLKIRTLASPFQFLNYHSSYCMQALGDGTGTFLHAFLRICVFYIPLMYLFDYLFAETGLCAAFPVGEACGGMVALLLLRHTYRTKLGETTP